MSDENLTPMPEEPLMEPPTPEPAVSAEPAPAPEWVAPVPESPAPAADPGFDPAGAPVPPAPQYAAPAPPPPPAPPAPQYAPPAPPAAPMGGQYAPPTAPGYSPAPPQPQGYAPPAASASGKSKVTAGILAILLGGFGVHKFYLGYTKEGVIMLAVSLISFFSLAGIVAIIGLVEGILYLTKTDQEFDATYVYGRKPWF